MTRTPFVKPGFEPVYEAFNAQLEMPGELGSALCIYLKGEPVVDLWGGTADPRKDHPWQHDTVVSLFSAGKALTALCLLHLEDLGHLSLEDRVVDHWPEFARVDGDSKSKVTLSHLINHRAGLPVATANRPGDVFNWDRMIAALENSPLVMPAGSAMAYHAVTFGHLVGEVIRRITGLTPAEYFQKHFADPFDLDLSLRFRPDHAHRVARCDGDDLRTRFNLWRSARFPARNTGWQSLYYGPCDHDYHPNSTRWRQAEAPSVTGFGTAQGLAKLYSLLVSGSGQTRDKPVSKGLISKLLQGEHGFQLDAGTGQQARINDGFYFNGGPFGDFGLGEQSFGHVGMGGVTSFADPEHGVGFGYVCNHLYRPATGDSSIIGTRAVRLATAFYDARSMITSTALSEKSPSAVDHPSKKVR